MKKFIPLFIGLISAILIGVFFSYRILETPPGLTIDEASIGYNAVLISKTLRDETGRFLPIFPLTVNGQDWKQPSSVYATAVMFKFFGPSVFSLRMISVLTAIFSLILIVYLNFLLLGKKGAIVSSLIFLTAPIVLIHSHLAQENIMPIPFVTAWLLGIILFKKEKSLRFLLFSGLSLGLGIYSYKGMRAIVPSLASVTIIYLLLTQDRKTSSKRFLDQFASIIIFCLGLSPFVLIMPWINAHYPGALFDRQAFHLLKYYDFLYPYLSSFDISALFIKGDITPWHSTGFHGVFLVSTLPLFIAGLVSASRQTKPDHFWVFLLFSLFVTPLLFGQVGSVYRFSRLLVLVPFFVTFCTLGVMKLLEAKRGALMVTVLSIFILFNFVDFVRYYWYTYPVIARTYFMPSNTVADAYQYMSKIAKKNHLTPYVENGSAKADGQTGLFLEAAYFDVSLKSWQAGTAIPPKSILMSKLGHQPKLKTIGSPLYEYNFFVNEGEDIIDLW